MPWRILLNLKLVLFFRYVIVAGIEYLSVDLLTRHFGTTKSGMREKCMFWSILSSVVVEFEVSLQHGKKTQAVVSVRGIFLC